MKSNCKQIYVCAGTGCTSSEALAIYGNFVKDLSDRKLNDVKLIKTGCFGLCSMGPVVVTEPDGCFYTKVKPEDVETIVSQHVENGQPVISLLYKENGVPVKLFDAQFYGKQKRVALARCGVTDPESIDSYLESSGYKALEKILAGTSQDEIIDIVKKSGLRGRGGGGFPTGQKWEFAKNAPGKQKYVICNADEGDPGAFMDRSILEGDPFSVIEAMTIAGYTIGANTGYIYVRAEYPLAIDRLKIALEQAMERGFLGKNILKSGFDFDILIRRGAGAFVCGEETALINSIEGKQGSPRVRPPFPAVSGLNGCPTLINNVETFANICQIILQGPQWFSAMGTKGSPGTKVFALGGNVNNIGLVEVPMGITLREIVYDIGGGIPDGRQFKAAQTGGPSGGCIPLQHIDTIIDYESLKEIGSMMGSGGLIVMDDSKCMVALAKFFMEFMVEESCGKCAPCRIGLVRIYELLRKITEGRGSMKDIDTLEELSQMISTSSACALGQTSPNPVKTTLRYFRDEYEAHVRDKKCIAGECTQLISYEITDACIGCTKCLKDCPVKAITGKVKEKHSIDKSICIKCDSCVQACPKKAIVKS
ncbi:MAG: NADH-quinone oxidoreductase subunit NuoF [Spirochaetes bacterium]|nr:NADH-quinone oxidoreductase subunit NuoF [Spirochaetota bacterium]